MSVAAAGSLLYWKEAAISAAEYQDMPKTRYLIDLENQNNLKRQGLENPTPTPTPVNQKSKKK